MKKIMKWMHRGGALLLIAAMLFTQSGIVSLAEETGSVITIASAEDLVLLADREFFHRKDFCDDRRY